MIFSLDFHDIPDIDEYEFRKLFQYMKERVALNQSICPNDKLSAIKYHFLKQYTHVEPYENEIVQLFNMYLLNTNQLEDTKLVYLIEDTFV